MPTPLMNQDGTGMVVCTSIPPHICIREMNTMQSAIQVPLSSSSYRFDVVPNLLDRLNPVVVLLPVFVEYADPLDRCVEVEASDSSSTVVV